MPSSTPASPPSDRPGGVRSPVAGDDDRGAAARSRAPARGGWRSRLKHPAAKPLLFALCLIPFAQLLLGALTQNLGANPAEALIRGTGDWTLRFICIGLSITPLRVIGKTPELARFRRMVGLFTFFYAVLHLSAYAWLDGGLDLGFIVSDIVQRPFILVGFAAVVGLSLLAATSFNRAIRWLGGRRWQGLHRLVYAIALLGLLHFFWMRAGKNDFNEVALYGAIIALLLGWRAVRALRGRA